MIFWPPHLFIPDRTRCFQQPQIFPPWRQWKEAGAKSIVLLWQRIPHFPGDDVASATSGGRCRRIKCTQEQLPPARQDSAGLRWLWSPEVQRLAHGGACTHSRVWPRRRWHRCEVLQVLRRGYSQKELPITIQFVKIRWLAGKAMSGGRGFAEGSKWWSRCPRFLWSGPANITQLQKSLPLVAQSFCEWRWTCTLILR